MKTCAIGKYYDRLDVFNIRIGLVFNGDASERLAEVISGKINK